MKAKDTPIYIPFILLIASILYMSFLLKMIWNAYLGDYYEINYRIATGIVMVYLLITPKPESDPDELMMAIALRAFLLPSMVALVAFIVYHLLILLNMI